MDFRELSTRIEKEIKSKRLRHTFLAARLSPYFGISQAATGTFVRKATTYMFRDGPENTFKYMSNHDIERLSVLMYALGFPEEDAWVAHLKENYRRFEYPPQNGISYDKIQELQEAFEYPWEAKPEVLQQLTFEEKLKVLSTEGLSDVEAKINEAIAERKTKLKKF